MRREPATWCEAGHRGAGEPILTCWRRRAAPAAHRYHRAPHPRSRACGQSAPPRLTWWRRKVAPRDPSPPFPGWRAFLFPEEVPHMRYAHALIRTQRDIASEEELPSARLLAKAGLSRRLASGIYSLGPLARRALRRIEAVVRDEMDRIGGQEILLPLVQPAELWEESGRYDAIGSDLARLRDRGERPMVLAMTHEEAVT